MLNLGDNTVLFDTAKSVLESVADSLTACQFEVPSCRFVGFNRPSELTCPDLVGWANNVRPWDGDSMNGGLREGRLLCNVGYAFDITVRLGICYIEMGQDGKDIDHYTLEEWSKVLYQVGHIMYIGWVSRFKSGQVTALSNCDPVDLGPLIDYKEGGCAGWEFTITVGLWGMKTVKIQALANVLGLRPGEQVEIDRDASVEDYLKSGLVVELRKKKRARRGKDVPQ